MSGPARELEWKVYDAERAERNSDWTGAVSAWEAAADIQGALASVQSNRVLMERLFGSSHDLGSRLAYARIQVGNTLGAVAALESTRARLLTSTLARAAYQAAMARGQAPAGPEPYESITRQLERFEQLRDSGQASTPEGIIIRQQALSAAQRRIAEDVRQVPGFEYFGLPQSGDSIPGLLKEINVVYLFSTERGGYAVMHFGTETTLTTVPLPRANSGQVQAAAMLFAAARGQLDSDFRAAVYQIDEVCKWLGSAVVAPLLPVLDSTARGSPVALVPCGWFSVLPVHASWLPSGGSPDGRRYPLIDLGVAYIPSVQVLRAVAALPQTRLAQQVLVVAEPASASPGLPAAVAEADMVQRMWPSSRRAWRRDDVLAAIPGCTLAHFATHGMSLPGQPLRSSILVADDTWIAVHELMSVRFRLAPLCVLSACETAAVGHTVPDEGTGLVSGLLAAQARGVIAAMWLVDDVATNVLMTLLHEALREVPDGRTALRRAQTLMRQMKPYQHPFYWAGFCYTGA